MTSGVCPIALIVWALRHCVRQYPHAPPDCPNVNINLIFSFFMRVDGARSPTPTATPFYSTFFFCAPTFRRRRDYIPPGGKPTLAPVSAAWAGRAEPNFSCASEALSAREEYRGGVPVSIGASVQGIRPHYGRDYRPPGPVGIHPRREGGPLRGLVLFPGGMSGRPVGGPV